MACHHGAGEVRPLIIANPKAKAGLVGRRWEEIRRLLSVVLTEFDTEFTMRPQHATELARVAAQAGRPRLAVVGGDGTVNEVVNGIFQNSQSPTIELMVVPFGTGGDLARSLGLRGDLRQALSRCSVRPVDVGRATLTAHDGHTVTKHFLNISSFGSSGLVVDRVNRAPKMLGGKVSFALGTLWALSTYKNQRVELKVDDGAFESHVINTVAVANGRYFGGSMKIAPNAMLDDGKLDVVIVGDVGLTTFIRYSSAIYAGTHLSRPGIFCVRASRIVARPAGSETVLIDLDGEQPGKLPVEYEVLPKVLRVLCAPGAEAFGNEISARA